MLRFVDMTTVEAECIIDLARAARWFSDTTFNARDAYHARVAASYLYERIFSARVSD